MTSLIPFRALLGTALVLVLMTCFSCKKDEPNPVGPPGGGGGNTSTTISGVVVDESNQPIAGATVTAHGQTATTQSTGSFALSGLQVPAGRCVVKCTKSGYFTSSKGEVPQAGGVTSFRIVLMSSATTHVINGGSGGTATLGNGSQVQVPPNAIVGSSGTAYTGTVNMAVRYLDPTDPNFSSTVPGGDMVAQTLNQSQTTLYSYGIMRVRLSSTGGDQLQLASGQQSTITLDIPASLGSTAPATIPLWYYDETAGIWKEEGTATKQGTKYVGTVAHFTDWNCDLPGDNGTVTGLVIDCHGDPVPGIVVRTGQSSATTGNDGRFSRRVPVGVTFTVRVEPEHNFGLTSTAVNAGPLSANQTSDVGNLSVPCPAYVTGRVLCGNTPKPGQVFINWNGGYSTIYTGADGSFRIPVDLNKSATLTAYPFAGGSGQEAIQTPSTAGAILNLGTISVCSTTTSGNSFVVNGDGYNNQTFVLNSGISMRIGIYVQNLNVTGAFVTSIQGLDTTSMVVMFDSNRVGPLTGVGGWVGISPRKYIAYPDSVSGTITRYDNVGGFIEGTFEGVFFRLDSVFTEHRVLISNGMFSVIRQPDQ